VHWKIWLDDGTSEKETSSVVEGDALARPQRDFTVKVDVQSDRLKPKVHYAFQFSHGSEKSSVGKFHLPPAKGEVLDTLKYAIFSCSNWRWGYFNAYSAAARESLDFWLHVGDFIYEHASDAFPAKAEDVVRSTLDPPHETVSLGDYRKRYALYRSDHDLQKLSAAAPLISIWDDHEVANNGWKLGAEGHDSREDGDYASRRAAAMQVYHEWMPTRPHADPWLGNSSDAPWMRWRRLDFGDLSSLLVLETRHTYRTSPSVMTRGMIFERIKKLLELASDPPPEKWLGSGFERSLKALKADVDAERHRKEKTILGEAQLSWIAKQVRTSVDDGIMWRLVAQPLVTQERMSPDYEGAVALTKSSGKVDDLPKWQYAIGNATGVTDKAAKRIVLACMAAGRYRISLSFDDWMGYVADRMRLAAALRVGRQQGNVIYGGDTHNAWVGLVRDDVGEIVAAEFAGMSVSSGGLEQYPPHLPPDLEAAAWQACNTDLLWADTHNRGFMLVNLTRNVQHVEYRGVDVRIAGKNESWCIAAFEVERGTNVAPRRVSCSSKNRNVELSLAQVQDAPTPRVAVQFQRRYSPVSSHRSQAALRRGVPKSLSA